MSELAKVEIEDDIATITLDDGKANALGFTMIEHINKALDEAEACADVIVMTGREGVMTAGFDLKVMRNEPDRVMDLVTQGGQFGAHIRQSKAGIAGIDRPRHCRRRAVNVVGRLSHQHCR